tara:strand:+ start:93 stop:656 length:564 start_codon:yes stop_codon:yes gene_type:complete
MKITNKRKNLYFPGFKICKTDELCFLEKKYNSTYGELTKQGAFQLFSIFPMKNKIFCDLGSGIGNVLYYVTSIFPTLNKCIGIELSQERHNIAIEKYRKFVNNRKMEFYNTDLLEMSIIECDYIYISNLCFPEHLNRSIGKKIDKEIKQNGIVFSSKEIYCNDYWKKEEKKVSQTWDCKSTIYIYYF